MRGWNGSFETAVGDLCNDNELMPLLHTRSHLCHPLSPQKSQTLVTLSLQVTKHYKSCSSSRTGQSLPVRNRAFQQKQPQRQGWEGLILAELRLGNTLDNPVIHYSPRSPDSKGSVAAEGTQASNRLKGIIMMPCKRKLQIKCGWDWIKKPFLSHGKYFECFHIAIFGINASRWVRSKLDKTQGRYYFDMSQFLITLDRICMFGRRLSSELHGLGGSPSSVFSVLCRALSSQRVSQR